MEKVIREPKAWQGCGQEGQTEGKSALAKSSFSIFRSLKIHAPPQHHLYTDPVLMRELRADSEEGKCTSTDKDHGQGHRIKALPRKYMAMLHGIPTAVLTQRKFINNNSVSSHGADCLDFHCSLHMPYFLLMLLFLAADTYL